MVPPPSSHRFAAAVAPATPLPIVPPVHDTAPYTVRSVLVTLCVCALGTCCAIAPLVTVRPSVDT
jgi:hypothetical protein